MATTWRRRARYNKTIKQKIRSALGRFNNGILIKKPTNRYYFRMGTKRLETRTKMLACHYALNKAHIFDKYGPRPSIWFNRRAPIKPPLSSKQIRLQMLRKESDYMIKQILKRIKR
jgi:hypothetical protein